VSIESNIQLLITILSMVAFVWNVYVLIYTKRSAPLKSRLAEERPFTKGATRAVILIVLANTVSLLNMTYVALIRNSYTLPVLTDKAPTGVVWLVIEQYILTYAVSVLPATLLFWLVWALREHDRIVDIRLQKRYEMARQRRG